jgi:NAD(P)H dehydrogenase (quinone)
MILITGATGHLGKGTIDHLLKKGVSANSIAALVRDEAKAAELKAKSIHIHKGDYNDYASLVAAFRGIDKVLLVSSNDVHNRLNQQQNAVKAAREAGVKHIIYTSFSRKTETEATSPIAFIGKSHIETENLIKASGMSYTFLLNGLYSDALPMFFGEQVLQTGIFLPAGNGKAAYTTRNDIAEASANILTGQGHENKSYTIANTENYTLQEAATILRDVTGKTINYTSPTIAEYTSALTQAGVPTEYAGFFAAFSEAIKQGEFEVKTTDLEKILGRKPATLREYLTAVYGEK